MFTNGVLFVYFMHLRPYFVNFTYLSIGPGYVGWTKVNY